MDEGILVGDIDERMKAKGIPYEEARREIFAEKKI